MLAVRGLLAVCVVLALLLPGADARACGGAVLRDIDEVAADLAEAESSLEKGDLGWAKTLAREVEAGDEDTFFERARRIEALATVRDPGASEADLTSAVMTLGDMMKDAEHRTPALEADFAEAAARVPRFQDDARRQLLNLSDRDLMGSPYAYAALARLADAHGDHEVAKGARARCTTMALDADVCGPELRRPVLFALHGKPLGYAAPLFVAILALAVRLLRRKKNAPWIGFGARAQAAAFGAAGIAAFLLARSPGYAPLVMLAVSVLTIVLERRLFLRAVRAGRVHGFALRPAVDDDPPVAMRLHFGPRSDETLERVTEDAPDGGYRVAARTIILRMGRRRPRETVLATLGFAALLLVGSSAFALASKIWS